MRMARLGVLIDKRETERRWRYGLNVFEIYLREVLEYAGIPYLLVSDIRQLSMQPPEFDIVLVGLAKDDKDTVERLLQFADRGGTLIAVGGLHAAASRLGCMRVACEGAGYAEFGHEFDKTNTVRYLNAAPWSVSEPNEYITDRIGVLHAGSPDGASLGHALLRFSFGEGRVYRFAVDIPGTIVKMQQGGSPVLDDGIPAPDGSAPVNDGLLKADDRMEMDWMLDRSKTETGNPYVSHPYADYWREILIGNILKAAVDRGLTLPFIGTWPEGIDQVALISHDSDKNMDEHALATLELLEECGIRSTWCIMEPGYSPYIYEKVKLAGHELGLHYNGLEIDGGRWEEGEFSRQLQWFKQATGLETVISNKNHFTRFEGWGDLFDWCEKYGISSDQTRGPSKKGNAGFPFGTCQPYKPIAWWNERNRLYDLLEIGFLTQDMDLTEHWSDSSVILPFLEKVKQSGGVAHFLVHQVHICNKEEVRQSLRKIVSEACRLGFVFWTAEQINSWQRSRRQIRIKEVDDNGIVIVDGVESSGLDTTVWLPLPKNDASSSGGSVQIRYGVQCLKQIIHLRRD